MKPWPATIRWAATFAPRFSKAVQIRRGAARDLARRSSEDLRRQLRPRLARLPSRAHHRRLRVCHRRPRPQGRQARRRRRFFLRARHRPSLRGHRRRDAVAAARGRGRRALPLHRRLGRHHHRQEPGRHPRRPQRSDLMSATARKRRPGQSQGSHPRQRQSQVRLGEEGRADQLLHGRRQGAHPRQLRPAPRDGGALLRPQGLYPHQPAGRHGRRRLSGLGVGRGGRAGLGAACRSGRASRSSTRRFASSRCPALPSPRKPPTAAICNCACRATPSWALSSPSARLLKEFGITQEQYREVVHKQYVKKFGKLGEAVVAVQHGSHDAGLRAGEGDQDRRAGRGRPLQPARPGAAAHSGTGHCRRRLRHRLPFHPLPAGQAKRAPLASVDLLRCRVPLALRLQPARHAALGHGHDRRRHRRHSLEVRGPPRNPALHPRELHSVHGVHLRLPGHRAAQHCAGPEHAARHRRLLLRRRCGGARQAPARAAGDRETRPPAHGRGRDKANGTPLPTILREVTESVDGFSAQPSSSSLPFSTKFPWPTRR